MARQPSRYVSIGEELPLSNLGQLEMLRAMMERGQPLRMAMRGPSMWPFIRDQDVVTVAPLGHHEPAVGDIVAFVHPENGHLVVHRIVSPAAGGWLIRGDNGRSADGVVEPGQILGRVIRVERGGRDVRLGIRFGRRSVAFLSRWGVLVRATHVLAKARTRRRARPPS